MLGLIYKDLFGAKKENLLMLIVTAAMTLFAIVVGTPALTPCIGGLMGLCIIAPANSVQIDKQSGWNKFICASPVPRNKTVLALYLSTILSNCFFISLLFFINLFRGVFPFWLFPVLLALALLLQGITLPAGLRLGQTAVVAIFLGAVFGFSGLTALLAQWSILTDEMIEQAAKLFLQSPLLSAGIMVLAGFLIYGLSCLLSCRIYRKMEF